MKNRIEKYILEKSEELVFITINESSELNLPGYEIPEEGLKLPIKSSVLVNSIKDNKAQEELNLVSIVDAVLFLQGIDSGFLYNDEYDKFIQAFSQRMNFKPLEYLGYMSQEAYNRGEVSDALVYIKSYLRRDDKDTMALYQYAIICQELSMRYQKDEDIKAMNDFLIEASTALEKIIDVNPEFALAYYQLGFHYSNQKQYVKSKLTWQKAIELGLEEELNSELIENLDRMEFKVQYEEGYNLVFQGNAEEGLEKLRPLEDENPDWWNLLFVISLAYKSLGENTKAKSYLEKILIIRPTQVDTLVELALSYAEEGNLNQSIELLAKASKIKKDNPEILCNLGMAYLHNGDYDNAKYYIERAYEIDPTDQVTIACMSQI
ncbi:tetratricopeptide repeat protein [Peptostreptococcus equinus]|uniref:Tetratricopeptide repeat protein n=1 Tax=Peptostreptococcus equinus TaxID=3003601 RepID=A0ABY7JRS6_9FIRM|nr:tetratricopeptide repeat protein [Peptostreptococcus sp. CBA3647]WAW15179.1 tetratricopeptide repeat protein [Peptostreptococcus sp. CBA3647]